MYGNPITFLALGISGVLAASVLAWPLVLYFSVFLFDAPGSISKPINLIIAALMLTYPVTAIVGFLISKKAHEATQSIKAVAGLCLASSNFVVLLVIFQLGWF